jgi:heme exporter protein A
LLFGPGLFRDALAFPSFLDFSQLLPAISGISVLDALQLTLQYDRSPVVNAIVLEDLSVRLGKRWVLARLAAELPAGRSILITGDNGSGKTTLLRVLATAIRPTRGKLKIFGLDSKQDTAQIRRLVGLMSHGSHLYDDLTARQNMELVARLSGIGLEGIDEILEQVRLTEHADRIAGNFSAGMKRRLIIGRLLLRKPRLVLLDEPFGQLDVAGVDLMTSLVKTFQDDGVTVVIATHMHQLGRSLCDMHFEMLDGRFKQVQEAAA